MRTTLDLPDPLFRELKVQSALRGIKLKDFIATLLQAGLANREARPMESTARSPLPVFRKATGVRHRTYTNREIEAMLIAEDAHGGD